MITDLKPFFESNVRVSRAAKRARALALAKSIPADQFVFTKLQLDVRETGSPKHRDRLVAALNEATAALVGSPLVIIDPETTDVSIFQVVEADETKVKFEGDDEWFDLTDFPFTWQLFDPQLNTLQNM